MDNMRIIHNDAVFRAASILADSVSGSLVPASLKTDIKSEVYRSANSFATITLTWNTAEPISGVALVASNLTSTSAVRILGYSEQYDNVPNLDTSYQFMVRAKPLDEMTFGEELGFTAFGNRPSTGAIWFPTQYCKKLTISISDSSLPYIEIGRLIAGQHWSPSINPDFGNEVGIVDSTKNYRNDAGDLMSDAGFIFRSQKFNMSAMLPVDREKLWRILWANGLRKPLFVDLYPNISDQLLRQTHMMYCKLVANSTMTTPFFNKTTANLELEEL